MEAIIPTNRVRYAVLEAVYTKARSERLVVAYATMKSLRELIAGSRIIACDFQSRTEASEFARFNTPVSQPRRLMRLRTGLSLARMGKAITRQFASLSAFLAGRYSRPAMALVRR